MLAALTKIEHFVGHPLHWSICLLHMKEMPLRHLLQKLDGPTQGPRVWSESVGSSLDGVESLTIVRFNKIAVSLPVAWNLL